MLLLPKTAYMYKVHIHVDMLVQRMYSIKQIIFADITFIST